MPRFRDGQWELMDHNPHTGATYWRYFDGERWHFRTDHDAEQIIAGNKAAQAEYASKRAGEGIGDPVASVPLNVFFDQLADPMREHDSKFIKRWLNDSDNRDWRVKAGRL